MASHSCDLQLGGIRLCDTTPQGLHAAQQRFLQALGALDLGTHVVVTQGQDANGYFARTHLSPDSLRDLAPDFDTSGLCRKLGLDPHANSDDLKSEILLAMLAGPVCFSFPSYDELVSAIRVRQHIVQAARKTALAFDTEHAERPEQYWTYALGRGFTIRPGQSLIPALEKTTQPERSGKLYSFSCYRATEYVLLVGIARELALCNPGMLAALQAQWETRAIMSGEFHDVFLHEYGSMSEPLPPKYYVPGDRVWFRNPDEPSSNVEGYEGSWVFYLGDGYFTNFWKRDQPFTLTTKCVELFHWRNGTYRDQNGKLQVDDDVVDLRVAQSLQDPDEVADIVRQMLRLRDPGGVYQDGGCVDRTREYVRRLCLDTCELVFPGATPPH